MKLVNASRVIFPLLLLLLGTGAVAAQKAGGYATIRVFDCNKGVGMGAGYLQSKMIIVYEDGATDELELLPYSEKNETENLKKVNQAINQLKLKGYFLIAQSTTGEQGSLVTDYTFLKQE